MTILMCVGLALFWLAGQKPQFNIWGQDAISMIRADLSLPGAELFAEERAVDVAPKEILFTWGLGVLLQAANAAVTVDKANVPFLQSVLASSEKYWNETGPVPGFDVRPVPKPVDRYYDDNEWMVLGLVESSQLLHSKKLFQRAKDTFAYVMSGRDAVLGDGVYWKETEKSSKNTCSNGPAAAAALALYDVEKNPKYITIAEDIYGWTRSHLRDPKDGLYWDSISLNGSIQKSKWSYNTALMLRTAADLYRITHKAQYADDSREMQSASLRHWFGLDGTLKDDGKFIHLLLENWIRTYREVPGSADPRPAIQSGLMFLHATQRDSLGHYGNRWDTAAKGDYSPYKLIDQASAARAYFIAEQMYKESGQG